MEGDGPPGGTAAAIDGQKEDGNVHLAGLDQKLGGIRAYESALKRIRQLEVSIELSSTPTVCLRADSVPLGR